MSQPGTASSPNQTEPSGATVTAFGDRSGTGREYSVTPPNDCVASLLVVTTSAAGSGQLDPGGRRSTNTLPATESMTTMAAAKTRLRLIPDVSSLARLFSATLGEPLVLRRGGPRTFVHSRTGGEIYRGGVSTANMKMTSERRRLAITTVEGALVGLVLIFGTMAVAFLGAVSPIQPS